MVKFGLEDVSWFASGTQSALGSMTGTPSTNSGNTVDLAVGSLLPISVAVHWSMSYTGSVDSASSFFVNLYAEWQFATGAEPSAAQHFLLRLGQHNISSPGTTSARLSPSQIYTAATRSRYLRIRESVDSIFTGGARVPNHNMRIGRIWGSSQ